jgi:cob(I)alamin adenosyltransferase
MVKINRIYTRTGDDGSTGLVGGERVAKDSLRVEAYGEVDELNSALGVARTLAEKILVSEKNNPEDTKLKQLLEQIASLQNELFDLGAELATPPGKEWPTMKVISGGHIERLESWIDEHTKNIPELRSFVLPGGTELNAALHLARTICRRAERRVLTLSRQEKVSAHALTYLNRLSDLLFAMARAESHRAGSPEYLWKPGGNSAESPK